MSSVRRLKSRTWVGRGGDFFVCTSRKILQVDFGIVKIFHYRENVRLHFLLALMCKKWWLYFILSRYLKKCSIDLVNHHLHLHKSPYIPTPHCPIDWPERGPMTHQKNMFLAHLSNFARIALVSNNTPPPHPTSPNLSEQVFSIHYFIFYRS